jgi:hypothetical protein
VVPNLLLLLLVVVRLAVWCMCLSSYGASVKALRCLGSCAPTWLACAGRQQRQQQQQQQQQEAGQLNLWQLES